MKKQRWHDTLMKRVEGKTIFQAHAEEEYKRGKSIKTIAEEMHLTEAEVGKWVYSMEGVK